MLRDLEVRMYGEPVGKADLYDDGTIDLHITAPNQYVIDWQMDIAAGTYDALTIVPTMSGAGMPPMPPVPASE